MRTFSLAAAAALLLLSGPLAHAQAVFTSDVEGPLDVFQLQDGRVLVTQLSLDEIIAFNADGSSRAVFATIGGSIEAIQLSDGRVLVVTGTTTASGTGIVSLAADGTNQTAFASGLRNVQDIVQLADGRVLAVQQGGSLVAFNSDGTGQAELATGLDFPYAAAQLADGRVLVTEEVTGNIVAFSADFSTRTAFGTATSGARGIEQISDGRILVADSSSVLVFRPDGTTGGTFGTAATAPDGFGELADGRILVSDFSENRILAFDPMTTAGETAEDRLAGLSMPYPNPSAAKVTVPFALARAAAVRLSVFDVLGREVQVLDAGTRPAGDHTATLDGARLQPGTYLVRLSVDGAVQTQRVTLTR